MKPLSLRGRGRTRGIGRLVAAGLLLFIGSRAALGQTVYTRQDVSRLTSTQIATLRRGIATMMSRPSSDPTSWWYQTNIHGTSTAAPSPLNTCQHGSYYFLAWHRMYLYYFERILRRASGDPNFALPYWNYGDPNQRAIPLPYRQPADPTTNPLYVSARQMNDGSLLPDSAVSVATAFAATNFSSPPGSGQSFGGQRLSQPSHDASPPGLLERNPHNTIHVLVGGSDGWMASVVTAARDPVFWLHHANIDRLWKRWLDLGGGRSNPPPSDTAWRQTQFTFYNEYGQRVVLTGAQILDTVSQLGYRYDDDPAALALATPEPPAGSASAPSDLLVPEPPPRLPETAAMHDRRVDLDVRQPVRVVVPFARDASTRIEQALTSGTPAARGALDAGVRRLLLNLEHIEYDRPPGVYWEIYINLPEHERNPDPQGPHFVGTLALFAMAHAGGSGHALQDIDITDALRKLTQRRPRKLDSMSVTFVPRGPLPPPDAPGRPTPPAKTPPSLPHVSIGLLSITLE
ncbi:MAG TPA: tyrosinase family protein [Polyangia bacterium]|jgi:tyrosinase|nr:tyrosinase family protein [Polyangia bacterium]